MGAEDGGGWICTVQAIRFVQRVGGVLHGETAEALTFIFLCFFFSLFREN
jgi:hypothetical protein